MSVRVGDLVFYQGKLGRTVKRNPGSGSFVVDFDGGGNGPWVEYDKLTQATVDDVFRVAGFYCPPGMIIGQMFGELHLFHDKGEAFPIGDPSPISDCYSFRPTNALNGPKWGWIKDGARGNKNVIDLSRLPAMDAWCLLPETVREKLPMVNDDAVTRPEASATPVATHKNTQHPGSLDREVE